MLTKLLNVNLKQVLVVRTGEGGVWAEEAQSLSQADYEMDRPGEKITVTQANKLSAFWHSAGHEVKELT